MNTTGAHYTVLARRFRPQAFDDVVGQEHVARALQNAIRAGRVAHAYMFTGARGVGKTSTARILAKALNCPQVADGVPCNQCEICQGISAGNDVDVLEIDGASNRGIDDIRSLRATVGVRSMRTQFKVYIIDEVHMLTREAFNALLKTLEEPPPNVKFVFCTTEPNKVPDTILSRCQRFDFSSINDRSIADRLREIAQAEGFTVTEEALELVARRARGSMRDSQSLFDQLLAFSDGTVEADDVHRMLGTAGDERLMELFAAMVEHRPGEVLAQLDAAFGTGVQPGELMEQVIGYTRDLIVTLTNAPDVALCSIGNRHRDTLMRQAAALGMHSVMAAFQILADARNQMFRSTFARTVLEMALVQVSLLENLSALSELLSGRLPALPDLPAAGSVANAATSQGTGAEKKNTERLTPLPLQAAVPEPAPAQESAGLRKSAELPAEHSAAAQTGRSPEDFHADHSDAAPGEPSDATDRVASAAASTDDSARVDVRPAASEVEASAAPPALTPGDSSAPVLPELSLSEETCGQVVTLLATRVSAALATALRSVVHTRCSGGRLEVELAHGAEFARKVLEQPENRARVESELQQLTGQATGITIRMAQPSGGNTAELAAPTIAAGAPPASQRRPTPGSGPATPKRAEPATRPAPPQPNLLGEMDPLRDPFVRRVVETFGATVVRITNAPAVQTVDGTAEEN